MLPEVRRPGSMRRWGLMSIYLVHCYLATI
jgi:hypothetical protein